MRVFDAKSSGFDDGGVRLTHTVVFLTTDDNLTRGASPGVVFLVHRKSPGRQPRRPRLAQWLGPRSSERAVPVRFPPGALCVKILPKQYFRAKTSTTPILGPQNLEKSCSCFLWTDDNLTRGARTGLAFSEL